MNLFFLGGSFDPPHLGHLKIAKYCLDYCDRFLFIPALRSPHKIEAPKATRSQRIQMLKLLIEGLPKTDILGYELQNDSPSYSWNTVQFIKRKFNPEKLTMVIGSDQLSELENWYKIENILKNVKILCFNRKGEKFEKDTSKFSVSYILDFKIPVSSSEIRNQIKLNKFNELKSVIPEPIIKFVRQYNIYH